MTARLAPGDSRAWCADSDQGRSGGFVTIPFVAAAGLTLVLLVVFTNVLSVHYARGVMQAAVEEGARQGVATGSAAACRQRVSAVVGGGLGAMAEGIAPAGCAVGADATSASLTGTFPPWLPVMATQTITVAATVRAVPL